MTWPDGSPLTTWLLLATAILLSMLACGGVRRQLQRALVPGCGVNGRITITPLGATKGAVYYFVTRCSPAVCFLD